MPWASKSARTASAAARMPPCAKKWSDSSPCWRRKSGGSQSVSLSGSATLSVMMSSMLQVPRIATTTDLRVVHFWYSERPVDEQGIHNLVSSEREAALS